MDIRDVMFAVGLEYDESLEGKYNKELDFLERVTGLTLPYDYRVLYGHLKTGAIGPVLFDYHFNDELIMRVGTKLRLMNNIMTSERYGIVSQYKKLKERIKEQHHPERLIPIGMANDEAMLLLDYRHGNTPKVTMLINDFIFVANSLTDFFTKVIEQNSFRRSLVLQYSRHMRAIHKISDVLPLPQAEETFKMLTSHIVSEEASVVLQNSERYLGSSIEHGVEEMMSGTAAYPIPMSPVSLSDITWWPRDNHSPASVFKLNVIEKHFNVSFPKTYRQYVADSNSPGPSDGGYVSYIYEGRPSQFKFTFLDVNEFNGDSGDWFDVSEMLKRVESLTESESLKGLISNLVPIGTLVDEKNTGVLCLYYKDENSEPMVVAHFVNQDLVNEGYEYPWSVYPLAISFSDFISSVGYEMKINYLRAKQMVRALSWDEKT